MKNSSDSADRPAFDASTMTPRGWMRAAAWRKRALAHEYYDSLDEAAREGISDEDYATTMATLERMARNLGWDESQGVPGHAPWRGRHHGRCGERHSEHRGDRETVGA